MEKTFEEIRRAIAKFEFGEDTSLELISGFSPCPDVKKLCLFDNITGWVPVPDYLNSHDAIQNVINKLDNSSMYDYALELSTVMNVEDAWPQEDNEEEYDVLIGMEALRATLEQKCESLYNTIELME